MRTEAPRCALSAILWPQVSHCGYRPCISSVYQAVDITSRQPVLLAITNLPDNVPARTLYILMSLHMDVLVVTFTENRKTGLVAALVDGDLYKIVQNLCGLEIEGKVSPPRCALSACPPGRPAPLNDASHLTGLGG